ncbi:hypothetical protein ACFFGH_09870 [Lysobacter korlensis]|uniref:Uncharacterized protein n=1 Tax=Lysobacter korlensis TaxID=553636 RepID=A0ABV6RMG0_9GAMM
MNLTLSDDRERRIVGFETLQFLAESEWAGEHEADLVAAARASPGHPRTLEA